MFSACGVNGCLIRGLELVENFSFKVRELLPENLTKYVDPYLTILSAKHILFQVIIMAFREAVYINTPEKKQKLHLGL